MSLTKSGFIEYLKSANAEELNDAHFAMEYLGMSTEPSYFILFNNASYRMIEGQECCRFEIERQHNGDVFRYITGKAHDIVTCTTSLFVELIKYVRLKISRLRVIRDTLEFYATVDPDNCMFKFGFNMDRVYSFNVASLLSYTGRMLCDRQLELCCDCINTDDRRGVLIGMYVYSKLYYDHNITSVKTFRNNVAYLVWLINEMTKCTCIQYKPMVGPPNFLRQARVFHECISDGKIWNPRILRLISKLSIIYNNLMKTDKHTIYNIINQKGVYRPTGTQILGRKRYIDPTVNMRQTKRRRL